MKIGIYGGSFNPIHKGHIQVAAAARDEFQLDRVLFMVAKDPPHKTIEGHIPAFDRYAMAKEAIKNETGMEACALEMEREGKSYTIDTVDQLKKQYAQAEIFCIVGADMLLDLPKWCKAAQLMREIGFIAVGRQNVLEDLSDTAADLKERFNADIRLCTFVGPDISSTAVREAVFSAQPVENDIYECTAKYIYEQGFYLPEDFTVLQRRLQNTIGEARYKHTMGTVRCAIDLAARFGADGKQARLAALLHDCAKFPADKLLLRCEAYGMNVEDMKKDFLSLIHGPLGAQVARREYGITDEAVLSAIYWHTMCRENMTILEKIVYLADKIEPGRDYAGVEAIRRATEHDLDAGVLACMERSIRFVQQRGKKLHPDVLLARDFLINEQKNQIKEEQT